MLQRGSHTIFLNGLNTFFFQEPSQSSIKKHKKMLRSITTPDPKIVSLEQVGEY